MGNEASAPIKQISPSNSSKRRFLKAHHIRNMRAAKKEGELLGHELISLNNVHRNGSFNHSNSNGHVKQDLTCKPTYLRCLSSL